jgi:hypothetical protein
VTPHRAVAAPCFADDPMDLVTLAVEAEAAGFAGFLLWDHMVFAGDGNGPSVPRRCTDGYRCGLAA